MPYDHNSNSSLRVMFICVNNLEPAHAVQTLMILGKNVWSNSQVEREEVRSAAHTLLELSKPSASYRIDYYELDYSILVYAYQSMEQFKSSYMQVYLKGNSPLKGYLRFSDADEMKMLMIYDKYNEIRSALDVYDEQLYEWSDDEPTILKDTILEAREKKQKQLHVLADLARQLKNELVNALA